MQTEIMVVDSSTLGKQKFFVCHARDKILSLTEFQLMLGIDFKQFQVYVIDPKESRKLEVEIVSPVNLPRYLRTADGVSLSDFLFHKPNLSTRTR